MKYFGIDIATHLEIRPIERGEDTDLFVPTLGYPIHLTLENKDFSRIQFPSAKALLLRLSPAVRTVTCHVLRDVDLFSSFANFEVDKPLKSIIIHQYEGYIELSFK
ncbi:MAG: hypothetical protein K0S71_506 [Clostridia bacterium]|jgi:hypothetical protein|nr:hypothetical protein [Clostridia bacterium]